MFLQFQRSSRTLCRRVLGLIFASLLTACQSGDSNSLASPASLLGVAFSTQATTAAATGSAGIYLVSGAMAVSSVDRLSITVTAADIVTPIAFDLAENGGVWGGIVNNLPAGPSRTFAAAAYDSADALLFTGQATGVTVTASGTVQVMILMQEAQTPTPFLNASPQVDSVNASAGAVAPGGSVTIIAQASDPNPGDTVSYAWSASGGNFSDPASPTTTWTAPAATGSYGLTLTVTDQLNAVGSISFDLQVTTDPGQGSGDFTIEFNTAPVIAGIVANPSRIDLNATSNVQVSASDNEDANLIYAWSNDCGGAFNDTASATPVFTGPAAYPADNECDLSVQVSDGRGGVRSGSLTVYVAPPSGPNFAPRVSTTYQSATSAAPGESFQLRVGALDPENDALTFSWSANGGTLGTASDTAATTENSFSAASAGSYQVTVTVSDGGPIATVYTFDLTVAVPVPPWTGTVQDGSNQNESVIDSAADAAGNIYIAGTTSGSWGGDLPAGNNDAFLAKYDAGGNRLWVRMSGFADSFESIAKVAVDQNSGAVYIASTYGGPSPSNPSALASNYLRKYDANGNQLWTIQQIQTRTSLWSDLAVDSAGNLYATGGTTADLDGTHQGFGDFYLLKFDSDGNQLWARQIGSTFQDSGVGLAIDTADNIYAAVNIVGSTSFDGLTPLGGDRDGAVVKYDSSGVKQWSVLVGTSSADEVTGIALDSSGSVYVSGFSSGNFAGQPSGTHGGALWKLSSAGASVWSRRAGSQVDYRFHSVSVGADDSVYVSGRTNGALDGQPYFGQGDVVTAKYDIAGTRLWLRMLGSSGDEYIAGVLANNLGVYIIGDTFNGTVGSVAIGIRDLFIARYTPAGVLE